MSWNRITGPLKAGPRQPAFSLILGAWAGYEAIHMIRKVHASGSALAPNVVLLHHFILGLFGASQSFRSYIDILARLQSCNTSMQKACR
jgi:hypothetical protein